jgi:hypothetical protein
VQKRLFFLLLGFSFLKLFAQESELDNNTLKVFKAILRLDISVRLVAENEKEIWSTNGSKYTIPGKAVTIKIEGNNIKLYGTFTPYYDAQSNLILLAQGQIFISNPASKELSYFSYFKTIYATFGEKVVFFPLGFSGGLKHPDSPKVSDASKKDQEAMSNIEIEIKISPYVSDEKDNQ